MRVFATLKDAAIEVRRDLAKGTSVTSSRVQNRTGLELPGRERTSYNIGIHGGFPETAEKLVALGQELEFKEFLEYPNDMKNWLRAESAYRQIPAMFLGEQPNEVDHPKLRKTLEGDVPSYQYVERLLGMQETFTASLKANPDTRRAFWPIFRPEDSVRAVYPTRIPCSLGYQPLLRKVGDETLLLWFYLMRSSDFDTFWLSDLWLARQLQEQMARNLQCKTGMLIYYAISLHSFEVDLDEVY